MTRSLKKGPFVDHHLMAKVEKAASLNMGWCVNCHVERKARYDCATCHY